MYLWRARRRSCPVLRTTWCAIHTLDRAGAAPTLSVELLAPLGPHHHHRALAHRRPYRSLDLGLRLDLAGRHSFQAGRRCHFFRAGRRRRCNSQRGYLRQCRSAFWEGCPAGDPRTAQHVPHAARAFGPGAANPPVVLAPPPPGSGSALGCVCVDVYCGSQRYGPPAPTGGSGGCQQRLLTTLEPLVLLKPRASAVTVPSLELRWFAWSVLASV